MRHQINTLALTIFEVLAPIAIAIGIAVIPAYAFGLSFEATKGAVLSGARAADRPTPSPLPAVV